MSTWSSSTRRIGLFVTLMIFSLLSYVICRLFAVQQPRNSIGDQINTDQNLILFGMSHSHLTRELRDFQHPMQIPDVNISAIFNDDRSTKGANHAAHDS